MAIVVRLLFRGASLRLDAQERPEIVFCDSPAGVRLMTDPVAAEFADFQPAIHGPSGDPQVGCCFARGVQGWQDVNALALGNGVVVKVVHQSISTASSTARSSTRYRWVRPRCCRNFPSAS